MHDHVLNWKLDLDINGVANSLQTTTFVPTTEVYPWSHGKPINTMKVERAFISNEDQGKINWAPNAATTFAVVNKDTPNQWGEYPGYRIYPSTGASIHLTIENSTDLDQTINWATHQLYALKRKDSEPSAAYQFNHANIHDPMVNFNDFFNGESLEQEDLVLYFNLGMHHMPDTSDLPNTVFTSAASGITIRPQNYLVEDPSRSSKQQVRVRFPNRGGPKVNTFGAQLPSGQFDLGSTNPDLAAVFGRHHH
jgi:primary-amine oxidase